MPTVLDKLPTVEAAFANLSAGYGPSAHAVPVTPPRPATVELREEGAATKPLATATTPLSGAAPLRIKCGCTPNPVVLAVSAELQVSGKEASFAVVPGSYTPNLFKRCPAEVPVPEASMSKTGVTKCSERGEATRVARNWVVVSEKSRAARAGYVTIGA